MGNDLFGLDIAKIVGDATKGQLLPATITSRTLADPDVNNPTAAPTPTETSHTCEGIVDMYKDFFIDGERVRTEDRKILIIAESITPAVDPKPGDDVTIEGTTYAVVGTPERDPAAASWVLQGRPK